MWSLNLMQTPTLESGLEPTLGQAGPGPLTALSWADQFVH